MPDAPRHYRFQGFDLDLRTRELRGADGVVVPLTGKAFDTLCCLIAHRDRLVGKEELLATVWPGRVVEENNLTQAICALRRAFGSGGGEHRFILTVPGRGYRFVAEVTDVADVPATSVPADVARVDRAPRRRPLLLAMLLAALVLFVVSSRWLLPADTTAATATMPAALAVLPFRALSAEPGDELLELGLAETLIARLGQASPVPVRSLAAVQRFADERDDAVRVGRQLGVTHVVEGSAQRVAGRMRVTARLVGVADGRTLWAGTFDEQAGRVFTLQDAIADGIGEAIALEGVGLARRYRSPCDGEDTQAYRDYLAGRFVLSRPSAGRLPEAFAALQRVIDRDPACARAYAALAHLYVEQVSKADAAPREVFPLARAAANRALELDPESADAWLAKAQIEAFHDWQWARADASYRRAIALDPALAEARVSYAVVLLRLGRAAEADEQVRLAAELDPLSPLINITRAAYLGDGDRAAGRAWLARVLEREPDYWLALLQRGSWALQDGDTAEAVADLEAAVERSLRNSRAIALLAKAYLAAGRRDRAVALLHELEARSARSYVPATALAAIHNALGDSARAFELLDLAYEQRDTRVASLQMDSNWRGLDADPRYLALAERIERDRGPGSPGR